jgi:hypothetical protein
MHEIALIELLRMVEADLSIDERAKAKVKSAVHKIGAQHGAKTLLQLERQDFARHLLDLKVQRAVIRDRLVMQFGVTARTAQRDITKALQLRQNRPSHVAEPVDTVINEEVTS